MALNEDGFSIIDMPPVDETFLSTFGDLHFDDHSGGNHKYRRFSQYRFFFEGENWRLDLLPHRPYVAYSKYNKFAGGIKRHYQPLEIDPSQFVDRGAKEIPLDTTGEWQLNVHQYRVLAGPGIHGHIVPEGIHQDGHDYVLIGVFKRHNISGAEMSLMPVGGGEPFYKTVLGEGQMVAFDDRRMFHYVTDIEALNGGSGYRDIIVVACSKWEDRWYGQEFEEQALEQK
ncbi:MAG TPA: 2OG-Fe dioxygenase family protein [Pyrinomonadaceae bacterium]|nr:2OG-Fe dioxygenase family protein [Pyrinomonadaceae bacterium]